MSASLLLATSVVIFVLDDVSAYEIEEDRVLTPVIDELAAQGVYFTRAYGNPSCSVARHSLLFSDWNATSHGSACDGVGATTLPVEALTGVTLPRPFVAAGYETAHFGKGHMGTVFFDDGEGEDWKHLFQLIGFNHWLAGTPNNLITSCADGTYNYSRWQRIDDGVVSISFDYHTSAVTEAFCEWWSGTEGEKLALVSMQAAHSPYHVPPLDALPPDYPIIEPMPRRKKFEAMVASADHAIGQMLSVVDLQQTLVVVLADNGTPVLVTPQPHDSEHGKFTVFEGGVRVPFVVAGAGVRPGVSDQLVHVVDLLPTLAAIPGAPVESDGVSFLPALHGFPTHRPFVYVVNDEGEDAVIARRFKLRDPLDGPQELYDLERDPLEVRPLDPDSRPQTAAKLRAYLAEARGE